MTTRDEQLASTKVPWMYLAQLELTTGTVYLTTWSVNVTRMGHTWLALANAVNVSSVSASESIGYPALDLSMNIGNSALLALARSNPAQYRGQPFSLWLDVLDDELRTLGEPELQWAGVMSQIRLNTGNGEGERGSLVMRCEQQGRDNRPTLSLRLNNAQHQARWPGDTFLSRVEQLSGQPVPWLSKRFQEI